MCNDGTGEWALMYVLDVCMCDDGPGDVGTHVGAPRRARAVNMLFIYVAVGVAVCSILGVAVGVAVGVAMCVAMDAASCSAPQMSRKLSFSMVEFQRSGG